jgi:hypothetical protein
MSGGLATTTGVDDDVAEGGGKLSSVTRSSLSPIDIDTHHGPAGSTARDDDAAGGKLQATSSVVDTQPEQPKPQPLGSSRETAPSGSVGSPVVASVVDAEARHAAADPVKATKPAIVAVHVEDQDYEPETNWFVSLVLPLTLLGAIIYAYRRHRAVFLAIIRAGADDDEEAVSPTSGHTRGPTASFSGPHHGVPAVHSSMLRLPPATAVTLDVSDSDEDRDSSDSDRDGDGTGEWGRAPAASNPVVRPAGNKGFNIPVKTTGPSLLHPVAARPVPTPASLPVSASAATSASMYATAAAGAVPFSFSATHPGSPASDVEAPQESARIPSRAVQSSPSRADDTGGNNVTEWDWNTDEDYESV